MTLALRGCAGHPGPDLARNGYGLPDLAVDKSGRGHPRGWPRFCVHRGRPARIAALRSSCTPLRLRAERSGERPGRVSTGHPALSGRDSPAGGHSRGPLVSVELPRLVDHHHRHAVVDREGEAGAAARSAPAARRRRPAGRASPGRPGTRASAGRSPAGGRRRRRARPRSLHRPLVAAGAQRELHQRHQRLAAVGERRRLEQRLLLLGVERAEDRQRVDQELRRRPPSGCPSPRRAARCRRSAPAPCRNAGRSKSGSCSARPRSRSKLVQSTRARR